MQNRNLKSHATLVLALLMLPVFCALFRAKHQRHRQGGHEQQVSPL